MYGTIQFKIYEINPLNERTYYNINPDGSNVITVYNKDKSAGAVESALFNINDFYVADRDYINGVVSDPRRYKPYITRSGTLFPKNNFKISESAFTNKKVFIEVITKIGSYHKSCDLCSDFTKDSEMSTVDTKLYNLNKTAWDAVRFSAPILQIGPYRKAPSGGVEFTGGGGVHASNGIKYHNTYLQFTLKE
jgi:hypothetical protein